jgi:hypothetical protein
MYWAMVFAVLLAGIRDRALSGMLRHKQTSALRA